MDTHTKKSRNMSSSNGRRSTGASNRPIEIDDRDVAGHRSQSSPVEMYGPGADAARILLSALYMWSTCTTRFGDHRSRISTTCWNHNCYISTTDIMHESVVGGKTNERATSTERHYTYCICGISKEIYFVIICFRLCS